VSKRRGDDTLRQNINTIYCRRLCVTDGGKYHILKRTPLHVAVDENNMTVVRILLEAGDKRADHVDENGNSPRLLALMKEFEEIFGLLKIGEEELDD